METLPQLLEIKSVAEKVETILPKLVKGNANCLAILSEIKVIENDEQFENATTDLVDVRTTYDKMKALRMEVTDVLMELKDELMSYERPLNTTDAKSEYSRARKVLETYQQEKLEKVRAEQALQAKKKDQDNHKVDLRAKMIENLANNVVETIKTADQYSKMLFDSLPLDIFDEKAETFKKQKPKLKQENYDKCFAMHHNTALLTKMEFDALVSDVKVNEPYDKWNEALIEAVAPIMNEWRARIPEIKEEKIKIAAAQGEEKVKLEAEAKAKFDLELKQRQDNLDAAAKEQKEMIQSDANMEKMSNEFASQAANQNLDDAGKVKLILKFVDAKTTPKALFEIMYHVFSHKDFPGIQKRDKVKKLVFDAKGRPEYIDPVQWWVDFFMDNCDAHIENTVITEDAKIVVRK